MFTNVCFYEFLWLDFRPCREIVGQKNVCDYFDSQTFWSVIFVGGAPYLSETCKILCIA